MSDAKPTFDPTQSFDVVGQQQKPTFDPAKPFEPVSSAGDKVQSVLRAVDKYSGSAGTRAAVSALFQGKGLSGAKDAFVGQFGENAPPAPSGEEQMVNAGVPQDGWHLAHAGPLVIPMNAKVLGHMAEQIESPLLALSMGLRAFGGAGSGAKTATDAMEVLDNAGNAKNMADLPAAAATAAKSSPGLIGKLFEKGGKEAIRATAANFGPVGVLAADTLMNPKVAGTLGRAGGAAAVIGKSAISSPAPYDVANFLKTPTGQALLRRLQGQGFSQ